MQRPLAGQGGEGRGPEWWERCSERDHGHLGGLDLRTSTPDTAATQETAGLSLKLKGWAPKVTGQPATLPWRFKEGGWGVDFCVSPSGPLWLEMWVVP